MTVYESLLLFAIAATGTPGPNNIMILSSGLNYGITRSIPHWLGICTGAPAMMLVIGLGLGALIMQWPWFHVMVKIVGGGYLLLLAYKIATTKANAQADPNAKPMTFWQAVAFQWVNPKAWVMNIGAVAAFTVAGTALVPQMLTLAGIFMLVGLVCVGAWLFAGRLLQTLLRHPWQQRAFNVFMAVLLVVSLYPMLAP